MTAGSGVVSASGGRGGLCLGSGPEADAFLLDDDALTARLGEVLPSVTLGELYIGNSFFAEYFLSGTRQRLCRVLSAFRPRGVPGPTSKLSPRVPAQMGRRETEHKGRRNTKRGNPRPPCCPAPRSGALAVGGLQASTRESERETVRQPGLPRGQPPRTRALDLPFIGVRIGPRRTMGV
jgi:hypothetical protein